MFSVIYLQLPGTSSKLSFFLFFPNPILFSLFSTWRFALWKVCPTLNKKIITTLKDQQDYNFSDLCPLLDALRWWPYCFPKLPSVGDSLLSWLSVESVLVYSFLNQFTAPKKFICTKPLLMTQLRNVPIPLIWKRLDLFDFPKYGSPNPRLRSLCLGVNTCRDFFILVNGLWLIFAFSSLNSVSSRLYTNSLH